MIFFSPPKKPAFIPLIFWDVTRACVRACARVRCVHKLGIGVVRYSVGTRVRVCECAWDSGVCADGIPCRVCTTRHAGAVSCTHVACVRTCTRVLCAGVQMGVRGCDVSVCRCTSVWGRGVFVCWHTCGRGTRACDMRVPGRDFPRPLPLETAL